MCVAMHLALQYWKLTRSRIVIRENPSYDKSMFVLSNDNKLRRFCQTLVEPGHGERIFGIPHDPLRAAVFKIVILCTIAASVAIAAVSTPVYRREVSQVLLDIC